jgi:hypothetical protein
MPFELFRFSNSSKVEVEFHSLHGNEYRAYKYLSARATEFIFVCCSEDETRAKIYYGELNRDKNGKKYVVFNEELGTANEDERFEHQFNDLKGRNKKLIVRYVQEPETQNDINKTLKKLIGSYLGKNEIAPEDYNEMKKSVHTTPN